eukprot:757760-Hanusia_phi.AAC.4
MQKSSDNSERRKRDTGRDERKEGGEIDQAGGEVGGRGRKAEGWGGGGGMRGWGMRGCNARGGVRIATLVGRSVILPTEGGGTEIFQMNEVPRVLGSKSWWVADRMMRHKRNGVRSRKGWGYSSILLVPLWLFISAS